MDKNIKFEMDGDTSDILVAHKYREGSVGLHFHRNLEIYGEELYLSWNGSPLGLSEYDFEKKCDRRIELYRDIDTLDGYSSFVVENAYQNELRCFLDEIAGRSKAEYTFKDDLVTLDLIDKFEKAGK